MWVYSYKNSDWDSVRQEEQRRQRTEERANSVLPLCFQQNLFHISSN